MLVTTIQNFESLCLFTYLTMEVQHYPTSGRPFPILHMHKTQAKAKAKAFEVESTFLKNKYFNNIITFNIYIEDAHL